MATNQGDGKTSGQTAIIDLGMTPTEDNAGTGSTVGVGIGLGQSDVTPEASNDLKRTMPSQVDDIQQFDPFGGTGAGYSMHGGTSAKHQRAQSKVSALSNLASGDRQLKIKPMAGVAVLLLVFAMLVILSGEADEAIDSLFSLSDSSSELDSDFDDVDSNSEVQTMSAKSEVSSAASEDMEQSAESEPEESLEEDSVAPENPYLFLPNPMKKHPEPMNGRWSAIDEETWMVGINHQYNYQHYKTVRIVRLKRLLGSEQVLFRGLDDKKFWTRMESVIALAEFGKRLKVDLVIDVVKGVNPHLVRRYFKRFNKTDISPGEVFVLRQFIRVVDGPARQNILRILAKVDDPIHRLYFAAATFDPSEKVKAYLAGSNINISSS